MRNAADRDIPRYCRMSLILLLPGIISLILVLRGRIETAFLSVYLPALLLLPETYSIRLPHFPPTSAAEFALIPVGIAGLFRLVRKGHFAIMDLLILSFAGSVGLSEILHSPVLNDAIFSAFDAFISIVLAYMAGRRLIEPDLRLATVRKFVVLMLLLTAPGIFEWRMGQNLYGIIGGRILGITASESVQLRGGHGRLGAAFSDSEIAGIVLGIAFCLNTWLIYQKKNNPNVELGKWLSKLEKYHVPAMLLLLCLWLTQSRGPQIAVAAAFLILQIPRFKNTKMMSAVVGVLLCAGYLAASAYFSAYTNISDPNAVSEQQSSAMYRRIMNELYAPIAEAGGWTGWGLLGIPHVNGMGSIDNHFLLVHLAWGRLAYLLLLLIAWNNIRLLVVRSWQFKTLSDRTFIFCMMGAMAVLWISLLTVYMGEQLPQVAFLLIGWIQSIVPDTQRYSSVPVLQNQEQKFLFSRVFR